MDFTPKESLEIKALFDSLQDPDISKDYAVALPKTEKKGYSAIYRNKYAIEHNNGHLVELLHPTLNTSYRYWQNAVQLWPSRNCLGVRKGSQYIFETYSQIDERKTSIGSAIVELVLSHPQHTSPVPDLKEMYPDYGLDPEIDKSSFVVAIFSPNRPEWVITDLACQAYSLCSTTLYDNLDLATSAHILSLMKCPMVFTSRAKILLILDLKRTRPKDMSHLLILVSYDTLSNNDAFFHRLAASVGVDLYDFANLESLGKTCPRELRPPTPSSPYTVCFTSGTTGVSKGVYITHKNMATSLTFTFHHWPRPEKENGEQLRAYCLLPLAHIYERQTTAYWLSSGVAIGFPSGSVSLRVPDCQALKPHFLQAVPRIYNKIEQDLKSLVKSNSFLKKFLDLKFRYIVGEHKFASVHKEMEFRQLDLVVTNRLRRSQGFDCVKLCLSASAPISLLTENFICVVLNVGFIQNYGASEVTSACTGEYPFRLRVKNTSLLFVDGKKSIVSCSGVPGVTTDIMLRDLPELGYVHNTKDGKPRGEVMFSGSQVFDKYVHQPQLTKDSFEDHHGTRWYKTGDICEIDSEGKLFVIDRIKNFFKLSQGEFLSPERIENIYLNNVGFLNQCFVHGFSDQDYVIAVVGIVPKELVSFLDRVLEESSENGYFGRVPIEKTLRSKLHTVRDHLSQLEALLSPTQVLEAQELELTKDQQKHITKSLKTINHDVHLKRLLLRHMDELVLKNHTISLSSYEHIRNLHFDYYPLKIKTGLLTPTLKLQRPTTIKKYRRVIEGLYKQGSLSPSSARL